MNKLQAYIKKHGVSALFQTIDRKIGLGFLERLLFTNWLNPFLTIYLNFRSFPLRQAWKLPIFVYGQPRFLGLCGTMKIEGVVSMGMIAFNKLRIGAPSNMAVQSEICNYGEIIFHGKGEIGTGNKIFVSTRGILDIGKNFKITDMCNIGCFKKIIIGEQSRITHRCQVFDSNYHYVANFAKMVVPPYITPVTIGKGCWICNSSTIMGGTVLPNFTIVGSNSLVNKNFSDLPRDSMIGGIPAKYIASGFRKVENSKVISDVANFYDINEVEVFTIPTDATKEEYSFVDKFM